MRSWAALFRSFRVSFNLRQVIAAAFAFGVAIADKSCARHRIERTPQAFPQTQTTRPNDTR
jgi:hypothetical protein